jgi:hypothetical protein
MSWGVHALSPLSKVFLSPWPSLSLFLPFVKPLFLSLAIAHSLFFPSVKPFSFSMAICVYVCVSFFDIEALFISRALKLFLFSPSIEVLSLFP